MTGITKHRDFGFISPDGCEIELIRALGQLRHPRDVVGSHWPEVDLQVETRQKMVESLRSRPRLLPLAVLAVKGGALRVFPGHLPVVERPQVPERRLDLFVICG